MKRRAEVESGRDGRGSRYVVLERQKGYVFPYECDPSYGLSMEKRERQ